MACGPSTPTAGRPHRNNERSNKDDGDGGWRQRTVSVILCVFIFALSSRLKIWICSFAIYSQERMAVSDSVVIKEGIRVVRAM